jgi:hypothetical protein
MIGSHIKLSENTSITSTDVYVTEHYITEKIEVIEHTLSLAHGIPLLN